MIAIIKRELSAYFSSAIGYIFLTVFYLFAGLNFFAICLYSNSSSLNYVFGGLFTVTAFLMPVLTMRLFSEEKKQKTDQALLTAPISLTSIVLGKYFSALLLFLLSCSITLVYAIVISCFVLPDWPVILGNFLGLFLLGAGTDLDRNFSVFTSRKSIDICCFGICSVTFRHNNGLYF